MSRLKFAALIFSALLLGGAALFVLFRAESVEQTTPVEKESLYRKLEYPLEYADLVLDYRREKEVMVVYYSGERVEAGERVAAFFKEYGGKEQGLRVEFIGLKKEEEEPPAGFFR